MGTLIYAVVMAALTGYIMGTWGALMVFVVSFALPTLTGKGGKWAKRVPMILLISLAIFCGLKATGNYLTAKSKVAVIGSEVARQAQNFGHNAGLVAKDVSEKAGRMAKGQVDRDEVCMTLTLNPSGGRIGTSLNYEVKTGVRVVFWRPFPTAPTLPVPSWTPVHHLFFGHLVREKGLHEVGPYQFLTASCKLVGPDNGSRDVKTAPWATSGRPLQVQETVRNLDLEATGLGPFLVGIKLIYPDGWGPRELPTAGEVGVDTIGNCSCP